MSWIIIIPVIYLFLLLGLALEAHTMPLIRLKKSTVHKLTPFSVVINYRNEAENLPQLLSSISQLDYDFNLVEFILINDNSTDASQQLITDFKNQNLKASIQLLDRISTTASAKKDGITEALQIAKHNHIITTDADCVLPQSWLKCYNESYSIFPRAHFIAAPVFIEPSTSFISYLQSHEMVALQMITMGAFQIKRPFMCNGANMSFKRQAFYKVGGYEGNDHISSGDDIFLLEKLWQLDSEHCLYLKDPQATVKTKPKKTLRETISQRARWAQKGTETSSILNKIMSFQVWAMSALFIVAPLLFFTDLINHRVLIAIYALKILTDVLVLFLGKQFFNHDRAFKYLIPQLLFYPLLVIAISISSLQKPDWRDRKINQ